MAGTGGADSATRSAVASASLALALPLGLALLTGCASAGPANDVPRVAGSGAEPRLPPWEIPQAEWTTQRIVRMRYDGPQGAGVLRLALRFDTPERFQVSASDRLGRRWWELHVREDSALVLWVRERTFCRYRGDLEIPALSLGPVPAGAVAALLLLRLPAPPRDTAIWDAAGGGPRELDFEDRWGRRWTATSDADGPRRWTLWRGTEPRARWSLDAAGMARLVEPATDLELQWQQPKPAAVLRGDLPPAEVPSGFRPGACGPEAR